MTVIDPFAGAAVAGTAARAMGLSFVGLEAHPTIAELAKLKLQSTAMDSAEIREVGRRVERRAHDVINAGVDLSHEAPLVARCFDPGTLRELVALRKAVKEVDSDVTDYLKWALLATLREVASVAVGWPYLRPSRPRKPTVTNVFAQFQKRVEWMCEDLSASIADGTYTIIRGDSSVPETWGSVDSESIDGCISSPPYLNNFDYADATRLELYFWGTVSSWRQMCDIIRADMLIATTQQTGGSNTDRCLHELLGTTAGDEIAILTEKLAGERKSRPRGKEYDRVIPAYFFAIYNVLVNLRRVLRPGACSVWLIGDSAPYGVYVDTPRLIGELAHDAGFEVVKDIRVRDRGKRWVSNATRHNSDLSERALVFRTAG